MILHILRFVVAPFEIQLLRANVKQNAFHILCGIAARVGIKVERKRLRLNIQNAIREI